MNYITILDFMVKDLHLKGNELIVYAIIYGFSQDGIHEFNGSYEYMKKWLSTNSNDTINKIYKKLIEKELITKRNYRDSNNNKRVAYVINDSVHRKPVDTYTEKDRIITPKTGDNNKTNINKINIYRDIIETYTEDEELRSSLYDFIENRKQMHKPVTVLALQRNLNKLSTLTTNNSIKKLIVNTSIENGWSSFYPLREQPNQSIDKSSYDVQFDENGQVVYE